MANFDESVWEDIEPIAQDDGPIPVVPINYDPNYVKIMGYFRAMLQADEQSERALRLTRAVIHYNSAHYTAWHFRRLCLLKLKCDLREELKFCESVAEESPKNYQLWHHRRLILLELNELGDELEYLGGLLRQDAKNYHVWSHRQWCLTQFDCDLNSELEYVHSLLEADVRNNSAWNQRHFVVSHSPGGFTKEIIDREIEYTMSLIDRAVNNESPWNYLRGLTQKPAFCHERRLEEFTNGCITRDATSANAHAFLVELYERQPERFDDAVALCNRLGSELDKIRLRYWQFRAQQIKQQQEQ